MPVTAPSLGALGSRPYVLEVGELRAPAALMLGAAAALPLLPDGAGIPCGIRALTGIPCPLCGMTTSVTQAVHFDFVAAVAANPAGIVAVLIAVAVLLTPRRRMWRVALSPRVLAATFAAMWLVQLHRFDLI